MVDVPVLRTATPELRVPKRRTGAIAEVRTWLAATPATPTPVMSKRITAEISLLEVTVADPVITVLPAYSPTSAPQVERLRVVARHRRMRDLDIAV